MAPRSKLKESACDAKLKPSGREVCKLKECYPDAKWRKGGWGKVMIPCMMLEPYYVSLLRVPKVK